MEEAATLVETSGLFKTYLEGEKGEIVFNALQNITLKVKKGEFTSVMGPSGSGKTTLLNMMSGLDRPSKGQVWLVGTETTDMTQAEKSKLRQKYCGFIFQIYNLIPIMSAMENVELPLVFQKIPEEERRKRSEAVLTRVGLEKRMHHRPTELSGGEQQRVAIARALVNDPAIILADEPTGNLDSATGKEIMALLREVAREGRTLVMVTHDRTLAEQADRILWLRDGELSTGEVVV